MWKRGEKAVKEEDVKEGRGGEVEGVGGVSEGEYGRRRLERLNYVLKG